MRARRHVGPSGVEALKATAWRRFLLDLTLIAVVAGARLRALVLLDLAGYPR